MARFKMTKLEKNWVKYDVGNSAFVLLSSSVIPIYFATLAGDNSQAMIYWGYGESIASLVVALLMPFLGSIADFKGHKIRFFISFFGLGVLAAMALGLSASWLFFLITYIIASIGLNSSMVFYDSMLTDVTTDERMDVVSSFGYAMGYIGSCIPFVLCVGLILFGDQIGLSGYLPTQIAFGITAVWWLIFTIPLIRCFKQRYYKEEEPHLIRSTFHRLGHTVSKIVQEKAVLYFILAYFFYIDGVHTIIKMATSYGAALGIDSTQLILTLLVTQIVAFPSAILYGRLAAKYNTRLMLGISVVAYFGITLFAAFFLKSAWEFWMLAVAVGLFQGGIQALSRSYFGRLIPKENSNEFFGFFDMFGKYASVIGTALVSGITHLTGKSELGVLSVAVLFVAGFIFLKLMPKNAADQPHQTESAQAE